MSGVGAGDSSVARWARSRSMRWACPLPLTKEWASVHTMATFLSGVLLSRMRLVTGATYPDLKLRHASCESVTTVGVSLCVRARAMASSSVYLTVALGMKALVKCLHPFVTTATMALLQI